MIEKVFVFLLFLWPLIFFHELGHFLFARWLGVRVENFSIGFGPKLLKYVRGGTEYSISLIPFGGYVKMYGDDPLGLQDVPESERKHAFNHQSKWTRFWIVFGGPLANFILAYVLFFFLVLAGEQIPRAQVGNIDQTGALYQLGVRPADVVVGINGQKIAGLMDFTFGEEERVREIRVERQGTILPLTANLRFGVFMKEFLASPPVFRMPLFVDIQKNVYILVQKKGELDLSKSIELYQQTNAQGFELYKILGAPTWRTLKVSDVDWTKSYWSGTSLDIGALTQQGFWPLDLRAREIAAGSVAQTAGLKSGDLIVAISGTPLVGFEQLRMTVQKLGEAGSKVQLDYYRNLERQTLEVAPQKSTEEGKVVYRLGIFSQGEYLPMPMVESRSDGFVETFAMAWVRTWDAFVKTLDGFKKLILNEVSLKQIGGPIAIGKVATDSFEIGLSHFFRIMAIISVNLGIINLFPIPVLDGGHITFLALEMINRKPLSRRMVEIAQRIGVSVLLFLIVAALYNDFMRVFSS